MANLFVNFLILVLFLLSLSIPLSAQNRLPPIDMYMHAQTAGSLRSAAGDVCFLSIGCLYGIKTNHLVAFHSN